MGARKPKLALCGGQKRKGGKCERPAGWGTQHPGAGRCKLHGGSSPQAQVAGLVELARRDMAVMGAPLSIEPQDAILECIRICAGEVAYASERIAGLDAGDIVAPVRRTTIRKDGAQTVHEVRHDPPALHVWIVVRQQAMDRLVNFSAAALRAGVQERLVKIAEGQGMLLARAVEGILRELGVHDRPEAPAIVRKHLSLVAGGAAS